VTLPPPQRAASPAKPSRSCPTVGEELLGEPTRKIGPGSKTRRDTERLHNEWTLLHRALERVWQAYNPSLGRWQWPNGDVPVLNDERCS
jgi:hypothetical protein